MTEPVTHNDAKSNQKPKSGYKFGSKTIFDTQVFTTTTLSYAAVNLKPVVQGHVMVIPIRPVERVVQLTKEELADMWSMAQRISQMLTKVHKVSDFTFSIQDGPNAGQTIKHVHLHILPRKSGDFQRNDDIYDELEKHASRSPRDSSQPKRVIEDDVRNARSQDEMALEASQYRSALESVKP